MAMDPVLAALLEAKSTLEIRALCDKHREAIVRGLPTWRTIPPEVRSDPAQMQHWAKTFITVAQTLQAMGDERAFQILTGNPGTNPIVQWQKEHERAARALEARKWGDAEAIAMHAREDLEKVTGPGADQGRAILGGLAASARFHRGRVKDMEESLALCEKIGDEEGIRAYRASLAHARRWISPSGPACRVVVHTESKVLEVDALAKEDVRGRVRFVFERDRPELGAVTDLVDDGMKLAEAGDLETALATFTNAVEIDPHDPRPFYLAGLVLLDSGRYRDALDAYEKTEALAPGWFQCRADAWIAKSLLEGTLDPKTFALLRRVEDSSLAPQTLLDTIGETAFAPLLLVQSRAHLALGDRERSEKIARDALVRACEPDIESRIAVHVASLTKQSDKRDLLMRARTVKGNLVAAAMSRVMELSLGTTSP